MTPKEEREARLAAQLRANLKKRKALKRSTEAVTHRDGGDAGVSEAPARDR